jgi:hypothetical protein
MNGESMRSNRKLAGRRGKAIFRASLCLAAVLLTLATLQILFDVPVAPFLVPSPGETGASLTATFDGSVQKAEGDFTLNALPSVTVQRGIPAELTLRLKESDVDACTDGVVLKAFGIDQACVPGDNVIRFTPAESGAFALQCRMGNVKSTITVVENLGFAPTASAEEPNAPLVAEETPEEAPDPTPDVAIAPYRRGQPAPELVPAPALRPDPPSEASAASETPVFEKEADDPANVGDWLENQLIPGANDAGARKIRTWTGWIFDRDCVGIDPVRHTKLCNLMGSCYDSGLGMFEYVPGKAFDAYTAVETFLCFDGASKELCAAFLYALPDDWKNNVTVKVSGYAVDNIPAAADELLIPESDLSRVTHYLSGIHVTKLEAAYIDGLSTNPLPEPNIVFSQP